MADDTANLQSGLTVKQAAKLMNVSERNIYKAAKIQRLRPDLADRIREGSLSIHKAYLMATGKTKPTSWDRLVKAWNNASDDDRSRLLFIMLAAESGKD